MKNLSSPPKIILASMGDFSRNQSVIIKDKPFIDSLGKLFDIKRINVSLSGISRGLNILMSFHPEKFKWRKRSHKNKLGFVLRSEKINQMLKKDSEIDLVIQLGVLFNASWKQKNKPVIIYTDYTSMLSKLRPNAGRFPFQPNEHKRWVQLERDAYHAASLIFSRSEHVRSSIIEHYQVQPGKVFTVGAGINPDMIRNQDQGQMRERSTPMILFIGKDFHRKGGDILLQAFQVAHSTNSNLRMKMVTNAPSSLIGSIEGVEFIKPTWNRRTIGQLYSEASIFVLPSRQETWGDVLLEAMAAELPCIGVNGDAMSEIIVNEETGLIVERENATALTTALIKMIENPGQRLLMGQKGRVRVNQFFTWEVVILNMIKILIQQGMISADQIAMDSL